MWECRRRPDYDDAEQQARLEALFDQLPAVGFAVSFRWSVTEVFDTAKDRQEAAAQLAELRELLEEDDIEFHKFFATYDRWKDGILDLGLLRPPPDQRPGGRRKQQSTGDHAPRLAIGAPPPPHVCSDGKSASASSFGRRRFQ
jgi:hypothetical protein